MIAIANTDLDWFQQLRESLGTEYINFWTPTPWNVRQLSKGDRFYFLLKSPVRKIGGYGLFASYENMFATEAWERFGTSNGTQTLLGLTERVTKYATKNSQTFIPSDNPLIGCILLKNPVFLDDKDFFSPEEKGLAFGKGIQKFKYFNEEIEEAQEVIEANEPFELIDQSIQPLKKNALQKTREGQAIFRKRVLEAYNYTCSVSGETCQEVLEAAHIQPYVNKKSNHVQNGLALRADLHKLFDAGLITISKEMTILISSRLKSGAYKSLEGKRLLMPRAKSSYPSDLALAFHREVKFRR